MPDATVSEGQGLRQCPTRIDGAQALIAQMITPTICQARQRDLYHKCFTCAHANERMLRVTAVSKINGVGLNGKTNGHAPSK